MSHLFIDNNWLRHEPRGRDFLRAAKRLGISYTLSDTARAIGIKTKMAPMGSFVIGSIPFVRSLLRFKPPGGQVYTCFDDQLHYYSRYSSLGMGDYWLNDDFIMLPFAEVQRRFERLPDLLGSNKLILKPDFGLKTFDVQILNLPGDNPEFERLEGRVDGKSMCLVSPHKPIRNEFRFVATNEGHVVTGSRYIRDGDWDTRVQKEIMTGLDYVMPTFAEPSATKLAENAAKIIGPSIQDPLMVIDVAEMDDGEVRLIEMNCLSTSGLYQCDPMPILLEIRRQFF